jgi:hypothetical protein
MEFSKINSKKLMVALIAAGFVAGLIAVGRSAQAAPNQGEVQDRFETCMAIELDEDTSEQDRAQECCQWAGGSGSRAQSSGTGSWACFPPSAAKIVIEDRDNLPTAEFQQTSQPQPRVIRTLFTSRFSR